ncbi:MAG: sulfotransferase [Alphaproteobacteria bacterium]|nr:sulfotransferase [Alphaproteobacteria bacterium]
MTETQQIFTTGTMRTGTTLVGNILSMHPDIQVFAEKVHFFRFVYQKYSPLNLANAERALHHIRIRWYYRFGVTFDVDRVMARLEQERELTPAVLYNAIMTYLLERTMAKIWTENLAFHWHYIPHFLNMFPNGKVFHVVRDIRGVLASWREMTFWPGDLYLNTIFNWIDSVNMMAHYKQTLPADRYMTVRFEDIHADPEGMSRKLCDFLGVEFAELMIQPEKWEESFDANFVEANVSSHTKKKVYGFNPDRAHTWKRVLEPWEVTLTETLAAKQMESVGYEPSQTSYDPADVRLGLDKLAGDPFLLKCWQLYQATGQGNDFLPNDPTDPKTWSTPDRFGKFADSPLLQEFESDMEAVERHIHAKYGDNQ